MSKGRNTLVVVSLIVALAGGAIGTYSFISLNYYIIEANAYVLPIARVYHGGPSYTIPSGAWQVFDYDQKSYDTHGAFNLTTESYSVPETGFYQVIVQFSIDAIAGDYFMIRLYRNSNYTCSRAYSSSINTITFVVALTDINNFTEGDSLTIRVYQWNPGATSRTIREGVRRTFFTVAKIA